MICDEPITYGDYADFFYQQDMKKHQDYFIEQLKCDFEPVILPVTKKPVEGGYSKVYQIPEGASLAVRNYARKHNMTDTMVCWGAYGILLSKYSGNSSILSSIVLKNRIYAETKDMAGMFVNTLPAHMDTSGSVKEYMQRLKQQVMGLFEHQELPFAWIADAVGMKDKSVINTSFVYQADGDKRFSIGEEIVVPEQIPTNTSKFDLMMELTPDQDGLKARMEFNGAKYDETLIDRLIFAYIKILEQLDKEDVAEIEVMSPEEYHQVIEKFNDTYVEYPREKCVHEIFTKQAKKTPEKVALVFEDKKFTYKQLDEMSDALAQKMIDVGIKIGNIVGAYLDRTELTVISQLAVLKVGGIFLPIDHRYPKDRIDYMLNDCNVSLILTDRELTDGWHVKYLNLREYDFRDTLHTNVRYLSEDGLNAKVIRVGNLTNRASDYKFQPNYTSNAFLTRVKAILEFSLFPDYLIPLYAEFSPIDKTAEGIVKIAQYADKQCVFHLNSNKVIHFNRFLEVVHELGIPMKVVSGAEFNCALQETMKQSNTEYIFEAFQNDMDEQGRLVYDSNIRIENKFTLWFLRKVGFEWNETDIKYISGYIDYFRKIGYLEI